EPRRRVRLRWRPRRPQAAGHGRHRHPPRRPHRRDDRQPPVGGSRGDHRRDRRRRCAGSGAGRRDRPAAGDHRGDRVGGPGGRGPDRGQGTRDHAALRRPHRALRRPRGGPGRARRGGPHLRRYRLLIPLLLAGAVSLMLSLLGTRYLIDWLRAHRVGQPIHEDVPDGHTTKAGTPTMGGVAIVVAAVVGYGVAHLHRGLVFTRTGVLVMLAIAGAAVVGALDDWIKVSAERNLGLSKRAKMGGLLVVAIGFAVACVRWTDVETTLSFTRWSEPGWDLGEVGWVIWAVLLILGTTNAVNLTDGLDGLAAGSAIYAFLTLTVIAFWAFRHPEIYAVHHALDLAVIAVAMVGGITGFLWWNAPPAQVFMG